MTESWRPQYSRDEARGRALRSMAPGSWQGRIAQAMPVTTRPYNSVESLDEEQIAQVTDQVAWEDDDATALTSQDLSGGSVTLTLSYLPIKESLWVVLNGLPQEPTNYSVNYSTGSLTFTLDGTEMSGDVLRVHYAHLKETASSPIVAPVQWVVPVPGVITAVKQDIGSGPSPSFAGDPNGMWNDYRDDTYVQYATFEHPDVSYASYAYGLLRHTTVPTTLPAGYGVYCRMVWSILEVDMRRPVAWVSRSNPFVTSDVQQPISSQAPDSGPLLPAQGPITSDVLMVENFAGGMQIFLNEIQETFTRDLTLYVRSPFLRTHAWRTPSSRVHHAMLIIKEIGT